MLPLLLHPKCTSKELKKDSIYFISSLENAEQDYKYKENLVLMINPLCASSPKDIKIVVTMCEKCLIS